MRTKDFERRIKSFVQKWAASLGVSDYTYTLEIQSDKKLHGNYAEVKTDDETREVVISVNKYRMSREPGEVEKTVVHELLHTRFNEYAEFAIHIVNTHIDNPKTRRLLEKQLEKLEHKIVVALTDALMRRK